jgi:hypothetical protein
MQLNVRAVNQRSLSKIRYIVTSNFGLTPPFRCRNRTTALEQHPNRLGQPTNHTLASTADIGGGIYTAAVNKNVVMDFSGSSLTNCIGQNKFTSSNRREKKKTYL